MIKVKLIVVLFNAPLSSGLDYAVQTMRILSQTNKVYGYSLGEPITWRDVIAGQFHKRKIIQRFNQYMVIRPFFLIPGQRLRVIREANYVLSGFFLFLYCTLKYVSYQKLVWFFEPFYIPPLLTLFQSYTSVYDCVDYFPAFSEYAQKSEQKIFHKATYVFANSDTLAKSIRKYRKDAIRVPLGFSLALFDRYIKMKKHSIKKANTLVVGYIGGINIRLDFTLLTRVAKMLPDMAFTFIGPIEENVYGLRDNLHERMQPLCTLPNVFFYPAVQKQEVCKAISSFDICIIPYEVKNLFDKYCFPMKLLEYFYMGKPVISTSIIELYRYADLVFIAKNENEFISHIQLLIRNGWDQKMIIRQRSVATDNSWGNKVEAIMSHISLHR